MAEFVLLLRDTGKFPGDLSAEEIQAVIKRYGAWMEQVGAKGGQKLRDGAGRVMSRNGSKVSVTDGPFAEAKEVLGGFFVVEAKDYDAAVKLCGDCPHLDFGSIEIREIEPTR